MPLLPNAPGVLITDTKTAPEFFLRQVVIVITTARRFNTKNHIPMNNTDAVNVEAKFGK